MVRIGSRLRERGEQLGLSQAAVARRLGISPERYGQYVRGEREAGYDMLQRICDTLGITPNWLFDVGGPERHVGNTGEFADHAPPAYVGIRQVAIRPGMGGGAFDDIVDYATVWFPEQLVRDQLRARPEDLVAMEVEGQSMEPLLESGDQVLIDRSRVNPTQPGIFALWDGFGLVVKWVERVAQSEPPRLRISSENPRFAPYEATCEEARILGRVVWYGRRL